MYTYIDSQNRLIKKKTTTTTVIRDKSDKITEKVEVTVEENYTYITNTPVYKPQPYFDHNFTFGSGSTYG